MLNKLVYVYGVLKRRIIKQNRFHVISRIINKHKLKTYAEIGVDSGLCMSYILRHSPSIKKAFAIDNYGNEDYNSTKYVFEKQRKKALKRNKKFLDNKKLKFIFKSSHDAVSEIKDDYLDILFIDGNHDYEYVKQDFLDYWPKMKENGFIVFHDYDIYHYGVIQLVNEYFKTHFMKFYFLDRCCVVQKKAESVRPSKLKELGLKK